MSTIRCDDVEGRRYRDGVYRPLPEADLPEAPEADPRFPVRGFGPPFRIHNDVPCVPRLRHLIGPSVIGLAMGLGAGEFLLWPNLVAVSGFSIWWLFWIGVVTQYLVLVEIERWTIATGESIFGGMARLTRRAFWPWFFLGATLVSFFWPGWASQSAEFTSLVVARGTGVALPWQPLALAMLAIIWISLAVSKIVYNALERFEMGLVLAFFPLLAIALLVAGILPGDVVSLAQGAASIGRAPRELLIGTQFSTLLLAVAYAGSGGTLMLAQSLWLRDKGFGMGTFQGRIAGLRGQNEEVSRTGYVFDPGASPLALARFRGWIRVARHELLVTFVLLILLSVVITSLLVASTLGTDNPDLAGNFTVMVVRQAEVLAQTGGIWLELAFLVGGAFVLFSTQLAIVDTVTRIVGSIFYERYGRHTRFWTLKRTFLLFLTVFVGASMAIVILSWTGGEAVEGLQPDFLVLIAGPFTIASMYLFTLVVGCMSARRLPAALAISRWRSLGVMWAALLWGWFTVEQVSRTVLGLVGAPVAVAETMAWHPLRGLLYGVWVVSLVWFARVLFGPGRGGALQER